MSEINFFELCHSFLEVLYRAILTTPPRIWLECCFEALIATQAIICEHRLSASLGFFSPCILVILAKGRSKVQWQVHQPYDIAWVVVCTRLFLPALAGKQDREINKTEFWH